LQAQRRLVAVDTRDTRARHCAASSSWPTPPSTGRPRGVAAFGRHTQRTGWPPPHERAPITIITTPLVWRRRRHTSAHVCARKVSSSRRPSQSRAASLGARFQARVGPRPGRADRQAGLERNCATLLHFWLVPGQQQHHTRRPAWCRRTAAARAVGQACRRHRQPAALRLMLASAKEMSPRFLLPAGRLVSPASSVRAWPVAAAGAPVRWGPVAATATLLRVGARARRVAHVARGTSLLAWLLRWARSVRVRYF
jgi:hypothetical protein